jgi:membrane protease YdiL (CAAX protease family)
MAWVYFIVLAPPGTSSPNRLALAAYAAGKIVQFGFPLFWVWAFSTGRLRTLAPSFRGLPLGLVFGVIVAGGVLSAYFLALRGSPILQETPDSVRAKVATFEVATPMRFLVLAVFIAGIHSLLEEYYWRWFVFGELRNVMSVTSALLLSSLAFMAHHVVVLAVYFPGKFFAAALPFSFCVAAGGAVWAWLYQRTGSIYSAWISHLLVDAAILIVGYDMVFVYGH